MAHVEQDQASCTTQKRRRISINVTQSWFVVILNALSIPVLIVFLQLFFDIVPFYPEIGAFIMVGGTVAIISCFPLVASYKEINEKIGKQWNETRRLNKHDLRELVSKMYFVSGIAEIPSLAGLFYFLATRDIIASFILCIPAIVMAVLCKPMLPEKVLAKLR